MNDITSKSDGTFWVELWYNEVEICFESGLLSQPTISNKGTGSSVNFLRFHDLVVKQQTQQILVCAFKSLSGCNFHFGNTKPFTIEYSLENVLNPMKK